MPTLLLPQVLRCAVSPSPVVHSTRLLLLVLPRLLQPHGLRIIIVFLYVSISQTNFKAVPAGELDSAAKIVIATDNDAPGQALAEELSRRLGRERCWRVRWPGAGGGDAAAEAAADEGFRKDANQVRHMVCCVAAHAGRQWFRLLLLPLHLGLLPWTKPLA